MATVTNHHQTSLIQRNTTMHYETLPDKTLQLCPAWPTSTNRTNKIKHHYEAAHRHFGPNGSHSSVLNFCAYMRRIPRSKHKQVGSRDMRVLGTRKELACSLRVLALFWERERELGLLRTRARSNRPSSEGYFSYQNITFFKQNSILCTKSSYSHS